METPAGEGAKRRLEGDGFCEIVPQISSIRFRQSGLAKERRRCRDAHCGTTEVVPPISRTIEDTASAENRFIRNLRRRRSSVGNPPDELEEPRNQTGKEPWANPSQPQQACEHPQPTQVASRIRCGVPQTLRKRVRPTCEHSHPSRNTPAIPREHPQKRVINSIISSCIQNKRT